MYKCRPSALLGLIDDYTAYCFDEACAFILQKIEDGEEPTFTRKVKSFRELYASYN